MVKLGAGKVGYDNEMGYTNKLVEHVGKLI
jgi:hypothetical protein